MTWVSPEGSQWGPSSAHPDLPDVLLCGVWGASASNQVLSRFQGLWAKYLPDLVGAKPTLALVLNRLPLSRS